MTTKKRKSGKATIGKQNVVALDATMDISAVGALRERLLDALALGAPVTLDAAATKQVDTAGLQLLCAFVRSAIEQKLPISWSAPPLLLYERARLLGLDDTLHLPADAGVGA
jgi:ABC-type transporter Mla MlaB component